jgi:hypothetical protein
MMSFLETLRDLIEIGFSPFMALVIGALIVLASVIGGGFMFFWRELAKSRKREDLERSRLDHEREDRDEERQEWHVSVEERLELSEKRAARCEQDRDQLHRKQAELEVKVAKLSACPKRDCPVRMPL